MTIDVPPARELLQQHDLQAIVVVSVERDGSVRVTTCGEDGLGHPKSDAIAAWGAGIHDHVVSIEPFQTVFGWCTGGVPTPVTEEQRERERARQAEGRRLLWVDLQEQRRKLRELLGAAREDLQGGVDSIGYGTGGTERLIEQIDALLGRTEEPGK